ncbi:uncharacterized protein LOC108110935 [Drosophila eugracilis]|uniref:uncharacterized protein LOC108110935 n=1 Tax=Drosophila eugracilis TaxID=29029 RepID=UPI001BDA95E3|nr:uncharacterized protein LOC108110935 [Drosophila eugracilis]
MTRFVKMNYNQKHLMSEAQFNRLNQPVKEIIPLSPISNQNEENENDAKMNWNSSPLMNSYNFNNVYGKPDLTANDEDFPSLSEPLPNVSIREQQRLSAVSRGKILSWHRNHLQRLEQHYQAELYKEITVNQNVGDM